MHRRRSIVGGMPLRIWSNMSLPDPLREKFVADLAALDAELIVAAKTSESNLTAGGRDASLREADIALGQPHPHDVIESSKLKWIHLNTAGYTRYDTDEMRTALKSHGATMTNSSSVYADPCAEHVLSFMLAHARGLPRAMESQHNHAWDYEALRPAMRILDGEHATIVGFGAIGQRLAELLAPFHMELVGVRRQPSGKESIKTIAMEDVADVLPRSDHVINTLPSAAGTRRFFNADRFALMKRGAIFYNVGRGDTVDQNALREALQSQHLGGAYVDVTDPEPLPASDPLWSAPNCLITPHIAGGARDEAGRLIRHFLANLRRYVAGETLVNRIV